MKVLMGMIDPDSEEDVDAFECVVCSEVRQTPELCSNCYSIICNDCNPHLLECPNCQESKDKIVPNNFLKNMVDGLKFTCPHGCEQEFRFADAEAHDKVCKAYRDPVGFKDAQEQVIMESQKLAAILLQISKQGNVKFKQDCPDLKKGGCPRGAKCKYKHPDLKMAKTLDESVMLAIENIKPKIKILVDKYKMLYCKDQRKGDCKYGEKCQHAHTYAELRKANEDISLYLFR